MVIIAFTSLQQGAPLTVGALCCREVKALITTMGAPEVL